MLEKKSGEGKGRKGRDVKKEGRNREKEKGGSLEARKTDGLARESIWNMTYARHPESHVVRVSTRCHSCHPFDFLVNACPWQAISTENLVKRASYTIRNIHLLLFLWVICFIVLKGADRYALPECTCSSRDANG